MSVGVRQLRHVRLRLHIVPLKDFQVEELGLDALKEDLAFLGVSLGFSNLFFEIEEDERFFLDVFFVELAEFTSSDYSLYTCEVLLVLWDLLDSFFEVLVVVIVINQVSYIVIVLCSVIVQEILVADLSHSLVLQSKKVTLSVGRVVGVVLVKNEVIVQPGAGLFQISI